MAKGDRPQQKGIGSALIGLINPIRDPSLLVGIIFDFVWIGFSNPATFLLYLLGFWIAIKGLIWLLVNFAFSFVYLLRKAGWCLRNPRLAWRLLEALGTEEIIVGGLRPDMFATEDGGLHEGQMGMMAGMMAAQYGYGSPLSAPVNGQGYGPGGYSDAAEYDEYGEYRGNGAGNGYGQYDRQPQPSLRLDEQSEQIRELLSSYSKLIGDWMGFTEEKWRAVSDSQLGWKPLRGRWNGWEEIYGDSFGAHEQQSAGASDAMQRRYDNAQNKGSAASAVACFLHDLDALRQSMMVLDGGEEVEMPRMGGIDSRPQLSQRTNKSPIIKNPMIVDADR
ncbi:MAG TPA: hypothetical protein VKQ30_13425 [Ktedonobacterales bacterium]|nr:hypothetical protein [Ktedonobacterales bacterium]